MTLDLFTSAYSGDLLAGVDEVGRGPLAGDVVAAAVILDPRKPIDGLADSKKFSDRAPRKTVCRNLRERDQLFHGARHGRRNRQLEYSAGDIARDEARGGAIARATRTCVGRWQ